MKRQTTKKAFRLPLAVGMTLLLTLLLCALHVTASASTEEEAPIECVTTRNGLLNALADAEDGGVIYVGDIDFNLQSTGAVNEFERITIDKSVTLRSGKAGEKAVLRGASFILDGKKQAGEVTVILFEDVIFDEGLDTAALTKEDWQSETDSQGETISSYPFKNQYAIECKGNVKASFVGCTFERYMHTYGPAIRAFYADYSLSPSIEYEHGDNTPYRAEILLRECIVRDNAALYGGGAIMLEGDGKNVTLTAEDCVFDGNTSALHMYAVGGGAIYARDASVSLTSCTLTNNVGNRDYGFEAYADQNCGGAIYCCGKSELSLLSCTLAKNRASFGGGVAVCEYSTAHIEGCVVTENRAEPSIDNSDATFGIASNKGLGGGIYLNGELDVTVSNTEICCNYAANALGAIFTYYHPSVETSMRLRLYFCTVAENECGVPMSEYYGYGDPAWLWFSYHEDFFTIPYLQAFGCFVTDGVYESDIPRHEMPTEANGYNYFGTKQSAETDGFAVASESEHEYGHVQPKTAPAVPIAFVREKLGDKSYYGSFTVGANRNDVTYRFFMDGECKHTERVCTGDVPTLPAFEKSGYTFASFTLSDNVDYRSDRPFIVGNATESVDVFAVFLPNVYEVVFDFGMTQTVQEQTYGTPLSLPVPIKRDGYSFVGFFTDKDGGGEQLSDGGLFEVAGDVTYYAYYEENFPLFATVVIGGLILLAAAMGVLAVLTWRRRHHVPIPVSQTAEEKTAPDTSMLSPREKEVLTLLLEGKQRNEIAAMLFVSENTVKKQITSIYQKLGVSTRNELFAKFK